MSLKVIGAGFGRTGTLSLKLALEQLGFGPCYHMFEVGRHPEHVSLWRDAAAGRPMDWPALFRDYRAAVDWPSCNFWASQLQAFPQARVILSERDADAWYTSVMRTIYSSSLRFRQSAEASGDAEQLARASMAFEVIWDRVFDGRMDDRAHVIACYQAHNAEVKKLVPADRLLVFDPKQGWAPLCAFLDCSAPDDPFPRVNTTEEFLAR